MKIKKRNSIKIGMIKFQVVWDKSHSGGSVDIEKREIVIGTKLGKRSTWDVLMHEISEAVHYIYGNSFHDSSNDSFVFIMSHKEFQNHTIILSKTLLKFIK